MKSHLVARKNTTIDSAELHDWIVLVALLDQISVLLFTGLLSC